jgi:hypothetical protein
MKRNLRSSTLGVFTEHPVVFNAMIMKIPVFSDVTPFRLLMCTEVSETPAAFLIRDLDDEDRRFL